MLRLMYSQPITWPLRITVSAPTRPSWLPGAEVAPRNAPPSVATTDKCLARSNKSRTGANATKRWNQRREHA